ncbi:hypothetical protein AVEN_67646-1 [Araneus ventricosus]|uniref:Mariner Mos1 transposase n=1 Tax=Araneus ventricosus TaxID=182803 RepID=A0A4Y2IB16_ARAVE|nr:hypothetical protein AVEN_67646-1 [Araneus ventricosus]
MTKIASRWVPHDLTEMQKWLKYNAARNHFERYEREGEAFLRRIITLDETWAKSYEPQLKRQSNEWRHYASPRRSKVRLNPRNVKVMLILVYDCDALRKKRRHFLQNPPIILQNKARPHAAQAVADLFDRWGWEVLYHHSLYSPDLSTCDFYLIPKMKEPLRGIRFKTVPEIYSSGIRLSIRTTTQQALIKVSYNFHTAGNGLYSMLVTTPKDNKTW